jgi:hypothetical protein
MSAIIPSAGQPVSLQNAESGAAAVQASVPFLTRLYIWSIVLEPLLFFVLFERTVSGITSNLSRLLQMLVLAVLGCILVARLLAGRTREIRLPDFTAPLYANFAIYFALAAAAGLIGFMGGAYSLPTSYDVNENESVFSRLLNSDITRPIIEYGVGFYYFCYFVILPQYLLRNRAAISHFFAVFKAVFLTSLVLGLIDFLVGICFEIFLLPRHIADGRPVGFRFHGLAGEPRDAFVYLFFGLAILHLRAHFQQYRFSKWWLPVILFAAVLTQSASGLIGIVIFLLLYAAYATLKLSDRKLLLMLAVLPVVAGALYLVATGIPRISLYLASASNLWTILETHGELPYLMAVQMDNIYPLYDLTVKFRDGNLFPILFGSGIGSASAVNNLYDPTISGLTNPDAQIVRIIFESGLVGTFFFIMALAYPAYHLTRHLPTKSQHAFMALLFLVLGCFFGHRTATCYIYVGLLIAALRVMQSERRSVIP